MEWLNEEIRRRERVIRIFPNRESVVRLLGTLLMELDEKWGSGKRRLAMAEYLKWRKKPKTTQKQLKNKSQRCVDFTSKLHFYKGGTFS